MILAALGFSIVAGLAGPACAENVWLKTANQDCTVLGDAPLKSNEAVTWSGSCLDGHASGKGTLEWIVANKISGVYEGGMADGKLDGEGVLRLEVEKGKGFDRLQGTFVDGEPEGEARYDAANGDSYIGGFRKGERHGVGYYRLVTGEEYYGDFENGQRHGLGFLIDAEGNAYLGQFEKGVGRGAGVFEGADGSSFQGRFANGLPDAAGTYVAPNGDTYQGRFKAAKADGMFLVTKADGTQSVEEWKNGEKVK
jgi:hypothetical protein